MGKSLKIFAVGLVIVSNGVKILTVQKHQPKGQNQKQNEKINRNTN
ncbi:hypothetical protein UFOVP1575_14 [uncultured Caudovirales phage]|uniref:Uncharacterized protein n=1 Tax=uncultured Caudovirales phage TaxID=2100421 RepID=A0A6J7XH82_9CAUD|nr:hypothetical protein UFOVP1128_29 [uncultured Caudovirales phage]CAB4192230.1 hypothetical protein UFOVP1237_17 [uncultured Caudovirales phage]CAB4216308.1 hypothetical protein UFOVP1489_3 [uncultured Caudovirales phage]CAB5230404.1 hypothetical protein UFOVP1575_14 [uncultured Caudovirales phage]